MNSKYRMLWRQMEGHRTLYVAAFGALILSSCFQYLVPLVPQVVMDGVLVDEPLQVSPLVGWILARTGGPEVLRTHLWWAAAAVALLAGMGGLFTYVRSRWAAIASERIAKQIRDRLYDHLQHLPCSFFDEAETGDLVQRCTSDVETLRVFLASQVVEIGRAVVLMLLPIPLMLMLDVRMMLASMVLLPVIVIFSIIFFGRVRDSFLQVDEAEGAMTSAVQENLTGIRVVRAFHRQQFEETRFEKANAKHRNFDYRMYKIMANFWSISDFLCMAQLAIVIGCGAYWIVDGSLGVGTYYFFLAAVNLFLWPIRMMGRILTELGKATVAIGRISEILLAPRESQPEVEAGRRGDVVASSALGTAPAPALGPALGAGSSIRFEGVGFSYGANGVLHDIDFEVRAGETVAFLGASGSGKSTLVQLLLRIYDPDEGRILLDGQDIAFRRRQDVRSEIAVVMQEPFLYSKTVAENIEIGRHGAEHSDIEAAARMACVHDSIVEFDNAYQTVVGERGVTLSGGQRQRVALARALVDQPSLLVLDDSLSAVDTETESLILDALARRARQQTTLVIAHRLSTLMHADQILVLDAGRIVQRGRHADLVDADGPYRRLWKIQTSLEDDRVIEREGKEVVDHVRT